MYTQPLNQWLQVSNVLLLILHFPLATLTSVFFLCLQVFAPNNPAFLVQSISYSQKNYLIFFPCTEPLSSFWFPDLVFRLCRTVFFFFFLPFRIISEPASNNICGSEHVPAEWGELFSRSFIRPEVSGVTQPGPAANQQWAWFLEWQ